MVIGIDVAKAELVVATRPSGERWTVANDERGVRTLVERLRVEAPELVVLEATGGYELLCVAALAALALPVNRLWSLLTGVAAVFNGSAKSPHRIRVRFCAKQGRSAGEARQSRPTGEGLFTPAHDGGASSPSFGPEHSVVAIASSMSASGAASGARLMNSAKECARN